MLPSCPTQPHILCYFYIPCHYCSLFSLVSHFLHFCHLSSDLFISITTSSYLTPAFPITRVILVSPELLPRLTSLFSTLHVSLQLLLFRIPSHPHVIVIVIPTTFRHSFASCSSFPCSHSSAFMLVTYLPFPL